ncbi:hypothetical protein [Clostridium gasigenes]|uniref:Uncharacterized protein n=1 Tax=Clostridium gasigenes TaxID=94869 RepID=A0A7X0SFR8_9CLOT|nr:hypothetical protein [Clostridium gasigenes]MBB6625545.1 hypothetical protein [Clostridium gasigenes]MBB6716803.1 hypothetical protein [Clostridium gasigenes]MBU3105799.1 hypothetical protein [Clostridium gasigenes]MBU3134546.1 hypothetical protein [Clostridium gasigenes]NKF08072.1 hypothetical protein [Clostridium gasigenes]
MEIVVVIVLSFVLSAILNNLAAKKGWKKKAEIYAEDRNYLKILPVVLIGLYIVTVLVLPRVGIVLPVAILLIIQVICITLAVFLFELFR